MYKKRYDDWLNNSKISEKDKEVLRKYSDEEVEDAFFQELSFGTAGLRGKLGLGTNRMNLYTVGRAAEGLARTISKRGEAAKKRGVAISYDVRHFSKEFAELSASILAGNGIKTYLYDDFKTTPLLSYTVLNLNTIAGIMVTASHNPKDYNGYKVYWEDGAQINDEIADEISKEISEVKDYGKYSFVSLGEGLSSGLIEYIGEEIEKDYLNKTINLSFTDDFDKDIKIVYTPLNGTGNLPVRYVLAERGFKNLHVVKEQEMPDSDFTTVGYPNPEDPKAFKLAEKLAREVKADIIIGTDPDCDRIAIGILKEDRSYEYISGNKIGVLLIDFITSVIDRKKLEKSFMVKSIVTGSLGQKIAMSRGVDFYESLTGFKNISGVALDVEARSDKMFLFGYEESIGFLFGRLVRDKDAVVSAMLIAEMVGYHKKRGRSLLEELESVYKEYGYHRDLLVQKVIEGSSGKAKMETIMKDLREKSPNEIGGHEVTKKIDYLMDDTGLQKSNVLKFFLGSSWLAVRPSGTEPKIKFYIEATSDNRDESLKLEEEIKNFIEDILKK